MTPESTILHFDPKNNNSRKAGAPVVAQEHVIVPAAPAELLTDPLMPTIFHESWWLDIVTGGNYDYAEVRENGMPVGRLPYFLRSRWGMKYSIMPPMTHFVGPAIIEGEGSAATRFLRRAQITRELIQQLPKASLYRYKCHHEVKDTIAFQQENFITNVQFTHEIAPLPHDVLWKNMRSEKRKKIRQAQQQLTVSFIEDVKEFWRFYDNNLKKKKIKNVCDETLCTKLIEVCLVRKRGRIYAARDKNNDVVAAIFCIWDAHTSFYFMSSRTVIAHNGAISLLAWEAMKDASSRGQVFDLDGLNHSSAVLFFTEFGGTVSPRYIVTRQTLVGGLAWALKDMFRENRYFY